MENYKLKNIQQILKADIKMEKTIMKFSDIELEKHKFHQYKKLFSIKNININKILVFSEVFFW